MAVSSEVASLLSRRRKTLDNPGPDMREWAKRVHGQLEHVPESGEIVEWRRAKAKPSEVEVSKLMAPVYDVKITGGAMLDYRDPKIPPGHTHDVKPAVCPPRTRRASFIETAKRWLPQLESEALEAEKMLAELRKRTDNGSPLIPLQAKHVESLRSCANSLRAILTNT